MDDDTTTVSVKEDTKELLDKLKVHENQPYDEVIRNTAKKILHTEGQ